MIKKSVSHEVLRPLMHLVIFYSIGIIGGNIFLKQKYVSLFWWLAILGIGLGVYGIYYGLRKAGQGLLCMILSTLLLVLAPFHQEAKLFKTDEVYRLTGQIESISVTSYYKWITLKQVTLENNHQKLKSKVQIRMPLDVKVTKYDTLTVDGKCMPLTPQMNPSDFDYESYLKGMKVVACFKSQQLVAYQPNTPLIETFQQGLTSQIQKLFTSKSAGIIQAALLGDDSHLPKETEALYQAAGISHVMCISGFHVGVIVTLLSLIFSFIYIPYTPRQFLMIGMIWVYALLTGCAPSTIRAATMLTVTLFGRALWQEEDALTNLAIAAFCILLYNPYQLFMVGFQLSFMAVIGIVACQSYIFHKELVTDWVYPKWQKTLFLWGSIQLFTWPIMAYHFYKIPFLISLINLIIIPVFSIIIIGGWIIVIASYFLGSLVMFGVNSIECLFYFIEQGVNILIKWPFATLCIGRPNLWMYIIYVGILLFIGTMLWEYCSRKKAYQCIIMMIAIYWTSIILEPKTLKLTALYVGQGDSMVIELPHRALFIIDGGNFGQGETLGSYINYLGYDEVEGIMVSHSDSDHIGGILELLDMPITIKNVFVSQADHSEHLETLKKQCYQRKIPLYFMASEEKITYGDLKIECLAPLEGKKYEDINDASMMCRLTYGDFSALLTGDKSKEWEQELLQEIEPVTLLKVSHHGSRTGTSQDMLLKLQPRYAMISCGRANLYGHPHQEVLDLLEEANIKVGRTDQEGAICYETDGTYITETRYRKDA